MKGKKCIGSLILCITFLLSLKVYSNTNALDLSINVKPTGNIIAPVPVRCTYIDPADNTQKTSMPSVNGDCQVNTTAITNQIPVNYIKTRYTYAYDSEKIYTAIFSTTNSVLQPNQTLWTISTLRSAFNILSIEKVSSDRATDVCVTYTNPNPGIQSECVLGDFHSHSDFYEIVFSPKSSGSYYFTIGNTSGSPATLFLVPTGTNFYIDLIAEYEISNADEEMNEKDNEDRSNIESQSSDTDSEANEQGDEATQTGTSLFNAFSQLLGALTNVNGNTCTLPAMQVYSLNLGNMNLCQYDIPPQIMALVSVGMVFIIIPLGINLVKRMISLYKEITG